MAIESKIYSQNLTMAQGSIGKYQPVTKNEILTIKTASVICHECGKYLGLSRTGKTLKGICAQCMSKRGKY